MPEIYFDNCATTRVDSDVADLAVSIMQDSYGNPSSLHKKGVEAEMVLHTARRQVAAALSCDPDEVFFTSGGTEADNLAILGAAEAGGRGGSNAVTTSWEHHAVLKPMRELAKRDLALQTVDPEPDGHIDIEKIAACVDGGTVLVSCMLVNSEVGGVADIERLVKLVKSKNSKTLVHCDAVQGFGKLKFSAKKLGVDFLSVSGHKLHAPKGVGALYVKKGARISPLFFGGGQEKSLRPGTESTPLIAAFGLAAESAAKKLESNYAHASGLFEHFVKKLPEIENCCINSPPDSTPYICSLSVLGYRSETLLHYLSSKEIYVSSGSACGRGKSSHVLAAMGLPPARREGTIRISFSKYNTIDEIDVFFKALNQAQKEIKV